VTPNETRFIRTLIDSGVITFTAAAELEADRERQQAAPGSSKYVWDLAVEKGLVTPAQVEAFLQQADGPADVAAGRQGAANRLGGYVLLSKLGQGGMGAVYKARQESMDRMVAIKVLPKALAKSESFIARFLREARAAGKLSHPNIVAGIDAGFADGYYYFAMEYVEGQDLGDRLRHQGPLSEREAVEYARQVALALDHAHGAGLVHRDVKPENILVTAQGQAKLCDLGLARSAGDDMRVTQAGQAVGTPYYISAEQAKGEEPDARSDIYSLGCTLYHLVAGRPPFDGPNPLAIMQKHIAGEAPPLSAVRPDASRALEAVLAKMMACLPAERYQTAAEVAEELGKVAAGGIPAVQSATMATRRRVRRKGTATGTGGLRPGSARVTPANIPVGGGGGVEAVEAG